MVQWTFTTKTMLNFVGYIDRIAAAFTSSSSIFAHKVSHLCCNNFKLPHDNNNNGAQSTLVERGPFQRIPHAT